jgi:hypothetical protein
MCKQQMHKTKGEQMIDYKKVVQAEIDYLLIREEHYTDNELLDSQDTDTLNIISHEISLLQKILRKMIEQENEAYNKMCHEQEMSDRHRFL